MDIFGARFSETLGYGTRDAIRSASFTNIRMVLSTPPTAGISKEVGSG